MPVWAYHTSPFLLALLMVIVIETLSLIGLLLTRRYILPRFHFHDGVNDAISGTVQSIGVFYGITVGLIAVGVWNTYSNASDLVSREAAAIGSLYRDVSGYPTPQREELRAKLRDYTVFTIEKACSKARSTVGWPRKSSIDFNPSFIRLSLPARAKLRCIVKLLPLITS